MSQSVPKSNSFLERWISPRRRRTGSETFPVFEPLRFTACTSENAGEIGSKLSSELLNLSNTLRELTPSVHLMELTVPSAIPHGTPVTLQEYNVQLQQRVNSCQFQGSTPKLINAILWRLKEMMIDMRRQSNFTVVHALLSSPLFTLSPLADQFGCALGDALKSKQVAQVDALLTLRQYDRTQIDFIVLDRTVEQPLSVQKTLHRISQCNML